MMFVVLSKYKTKEVLIEIVCGLIGHQVLVVVETDEPMNL